MARRRPSVVRSSARWAAHTHALNCRGCSCREATRLACLTSVPGCSMPGSTRYRLLPRGLASRIQHRVLESNAASDRPNPDTPQLTRSSHIEDTHLAHATAGGVEPQLTCGTLEVDRSEVRQESRAAERLPSSNGCHDDCENGIYRIRHPVRHWRKFLPCWRTADGLAKLHGQIRKVRLFPFLVDCRPSAVYPHRLRRDAHMSQSDLTPILTAQGLHQRVAPDQKAL
mmetsp:Transcript_32329/g.83906  ORF Transcript_32329/g.83906 Transcript_32329/m.83906 type:complete len:227 (-) Transcript_32329:101-781(-)